MAAPLPRLTYIGDVPVADTYQSSVQLHRLLQGYPPEDLQIIETRAIANPNVMRSAFGGAYRLWLTATASQHASAIASDVDAFAPDAVLTIASGFGWLIAAEVAERRGVPLHLVVHDDWPKPAGVDGAFVAWSRRRFAAVYRQARSRLCVSEVMIEEFERRYGIAGQLLYPIRSCRTTPSTPRIREIRSDDVLEIAFCGGSGSHVMPGLQALGRAVAGHRVRIVVFGPFDASKRALLASITGAFEFRGFTGHADMLTGLRAADLLFLPMAFDARARDNMTVSLPSKLVDYTAAAVPIVMHAPPYSGAARWADRYQPVAAVVSSEDPNVLGAEIGRLAADRDRRGQLAQRAVAVGAECFSYQRGRAVFEAALQ